MAEFGERLKNARVRKGLNQDQLASEMKLTQASISQFEQGQRMPTPANIEKFAEVLGVSKDYLVGKEHGEFERVKLMRNIKSLSPESVRKINDIVEMIRKGEVSERKGEKQ